jgi:uncharacterized protein (DUF488 family)
MNIYTIGHSTRKADVFLHLLRLNSIETLVDVRTIPRSRFNPQFSREILSLFLQENGIKYLHFPDLGGLRKPLKDSLNTGWKNSGFRGYADYMLTEKFDQAIKELMDLVSTTGLTVMCAEAVYWKCHRMLLSDALVVRDVSVIHILDEKKLEPHALTKFAKVEGTRILYPSTDPYQPPLL